MMDPAACSCKSRGFLTIPRCGVSQSDVVCSYTEINWGVHQLKSHDCQIPTGNSLRERMSGNICLKKSAGDCSKLTLTMKSCCKVCLTIPILVTVKTPILLCSSWSNRLSLTSKTQLVSLSSMCCNIKHLAQHKSQHKLQWAMLRYRTFGHSLRAMMANRQCVRHDDVIMQMQERVACKQKESEPLEHCAACNPNEACSREMTRNALFKQWREGEMDWGLCWERNRCGRKASSRCRDCD